MESLFLKLLDMSITASWLVLAVIALRFVFKIAPKSLRVCMWALVALRLVLPFSIESDLSLIPETDMPSQSITAQAEAPAVSRQPAVSTPVSSAPISIEMPAANPVAAHADAPEAAPEPEPAPQSITASAVAAWVWLIGVLCIVVYTGVSYLRIYAKTREGIPLTGNVWICDHIDTPFILGILDPRIFLPSTMDKEDLRYVIAHERAHLKRHDHWWKHIGYALLAVYWFNPVMWVAYALLCRDIELACDERVIREMGKKAKKPYSNALINCSASKRTLAAYPLAFGEVGVKGRIKTVLNYRRPAFWFIVLAVAACIVVAVCFMTDPPAEDAQPTETEKITEPIETTDPSKTNEPTETTEVTDPTDPSKTNEPTDPSDETEPDETVPEETVPDETYPEGTPADAIKETTPDGQVTYTYDNPLGEGTVTDYYETGTLVQKVYTNSNGNTLRREIYAEDGLYESFEFTYDALGNETMSLMCNGKGEEILREESTYDESGNLVARATYENGELQQRSSFINDSANNIIQVQTYDANDNLIDWCEMICDSEGNLLTTVDHDASVEPITEDTLGEKDVLYITEAIDNGNGTFTLKGVIFDHDEDYYNPDDQITDRWELTDRWCAITLSENIPCNLPEYTVSVTDAFSRYEGKVPAGSEELSYQYSFRFLFENGRCVALQNIQAIM